MTTQMIERVEAIDMSQFDMDDEPMCEIKGVHDDEIKAQVRVRIVHHCGCHNYTLLACTPCVSSLIASPFRVKCLTCGMPQGRAADVIKDVSPL